MKSKFKTFAIWFVLIVLFAVVYALNSDRGPRERRDFATFVDDVHAGRVSAVRIDENEIDVTLDFGESRYSTVGVLDTELQTTLAEQGAVVEWGDPNAAFRLFLVAGIGVVVFLAFVIFFLKRLQNQGGAGNILSLRNSRARLMTDDRKATFADVGGCTAAKEQLGDVVDFLRHPKRWINAGVRLPRGVLLEGPPGCGKTLLARAVAGETDASFYHVSASEFVEMFVGVGAARVRDMFETAAKNAPSVIFIDELDAVGRRRGSGVGSAHDEREQTLNQLLVCLDGFDTHAQVVVIAATNRPDILDHALLRPGRFDRRIRVAELSREGRLQALRIHTREKPLGDDVSLEALADMTDGRNGSEIENLANEAALLAVRRARDENDDVVLIGRDDFDRAMRTDDSKPTLFDKLDSLLIESTSQLTEPTGRAVARLTLREGTVVEGEVVWADAAFIKVRRSGDASETVVPKSQVKQIETLGGTEAAKGDDVRPDRWASRQPGLA